MTTVKHYLGEQSAPPPKRLATNLPCPSGMSDYVDEDMEVQAPCPLPGVTRKVAYDMARGNVKKSTFQRSKNEEGQREMKDRMRIIMEEVDLGCDCFIPPNTEMQFLDICCAPGGFSEYVLQTNPRAKGCGFSLDPEDGGHRFVMDFDRQRYCYYYMDITQYASRIMVQPVIGREPKDILALDAEENLAKPTNCCDLVIMDGSFLGYKGHIPKEALMADEDNPVFSRWHGYPESRISLLAAQLIVAMNSLKDGGNVVMLSHMPNDNPTELVFGQGILGLMRRLFTSLEGFKPRTSHQTETSFYMVCKGFNLKVAQELRVARRFSDLLRSLSKGAQAPLGIPFDLPESRTEGIKQVWKEAFDRYFEPLYTFRRFMMQAQAEVKAEKDRVVLLEFRDPDMIVAEDEEDWPRPQGIFLPGHHMPLVTPTRRPGYFLRMCIKFLTSKGDCPQSSKCFNAHNYEELHPLVRYAFAMRRGVLEMPKNAHQWSAPSADVASTRVVPPGQPQNGPQRLPMQPPGPFPGPQLTSPPAADFPYTGIGSASAPEAWISTQQTDAMAPALPSPSTQRVQTMPSAAASVPAPPPAVVPAKQLLNITPADGRKSSELLKVFKAAQKKGQSVKTVVAEQQLQQQQQQQQVQPRLVPSLHMQGTQAIGATTEPCPPSASQSMPGGSTLMMRPSTSEPVAKPATACGSESRLEDGLATAGPPLPIQAYMTVPLEEQRAWYKPYQLLCMRQFLGA